MSERLVTDGTKLLLTFLIVYELGALRALAWSHLVTIELTGLVRITRRPGRMCPKKWAKLANALVELMLIITVLRLRRARV